VAVNAIDLIHRAPTVFHPLIRLLATKPHLLAHHAGTYLSLASLQAAEAAAALRQRAMLAAVAAALLVLGVVLGGVALLLLAVVPLDSMPAPWLLAAVPASLLFGALLVWLQLRRRPWAWSSSILGQQLAADAQLIAEASAP